MPLKAFDVHIQNFKQLQVKAVLLRNAKSWPVISKMCGPLNYCVKVQHIKKQSNSCDFQVDTKI